MRWASLGLMIGCVAGLADAGIPPLTVPVGVMDEGIECASNPTQTYTLYVPSTYSSDRLWPVLLVFDPRGRSLRAAELFRDAAEAYGWMIVSSDNTRSDGPMKPNTIALEALWPEIHLRLPTDSSRIYAAGFSGGAAVAYSLSKATQGLAGILACGGRHFPEILEGDDVPIFATAGSLDFNYREMHLLDEFLEAQGNPHRLAIFEGSHSWMSPELAREAIEWFELVAMQRGERSVDAELVGTLLAKDLEAAKLLVDEGRDYDAARRYREIDQTYGGLGVPTNAGSRARKIEAEATYRDQAKTMKKIRNFERHCDERVSIGLYALRSSEIPQPVAQLAQRFQIKQLQHEGEQKDARGLAAQRCLNALYSGVSFYLPRDTAGEGRYAHAATSYELAVMIRDDNPVVWYNLACMRALLGHDEAAMEAHERAFETGFNQFELMATDQDLDGLRDREDFKRLVAPVGAE